MPRKVYASGFAVVPYALMEQSDAETWAVYAVLHKFGFGSEKGCYVALATIQKLSNLGVSSIRKRLRWLEDSGWVIGKKSLGYTTTYHVRTDDPLSNLTPVKNDTPIKNDRTPLSDLKGDPYQKSPTNKNPRIRTQEQEPYKTGEAVKKVPQDPFRLKKIGPSLVPADLADCSDLILEFWSVKKGTRSTPVFNRVCNKLREWEPADRKESLEASISNGWGDVFPRRKQRGSKGSTGSTQLISRLSDSGWLDS